MYFFAYFQIFKRFWPPFGLHFATFSILFACLFLALILRCSWIDFSCNFRCPEPRKPCSRCSGSVISYFSPFSKKHEKSMISASIWASFSILFLCFFDTFSPSIFACLFGCHFFDFWSKMVAKRLPMSAGPSPPLATRGRSKNASATQPRFVID